MGSLLNLLVRISAIYFVVMFILRLLRIAPPKKTPETRTPPEDQRFRPKSGDIEDAKFEDIE